MEKKIMGLGVTLLIVVALGFSTVILQKQIDELQNQINQRDAQIQSLQEQVKNLTDQLTLRDNQISELQKELTQKNDQISGLQNELTQKSNQIQRLQEQVNDLTNQVEELQILLGPIKTLTLAHNSIHLAKETYDGYGFYHYIAEFHDEPPEGEWFIMWMDDVFYMHVGFYDFEFLCHALDTYAEATEKYSHTPVRLNVSDLTSVDFRNYGALYFNIMVYQYIKVTKNFSHAKNWKNSVLKNHNYIKDNFIKNGIYYDSNVVNLQPDYVKKSGYIADMTIYYLASLKTLDYVYDIDTSREFKTVQNALIDMLWQEDSGFFIDWIDPNGTKHIHFGTEQLWGIVLDVLPSDIQKKMFESLPKNQFHSGRFWQFQPYDASEKTTLEPDWDNRWKIGQLMLYIQTLRKFNYDVNFIVSEINEYDKAIEKYDFCDTYIRLENGTLINDGAGNYIMNAGPWICILNHNDLSIKGNLVSLRQPITL